MITWQPCGKFRCFRERGVAKCSLATKDSIHVPDYSQLSTMLFEVSILQQRLLRLQYPQWLTEQHFTGKTPRINWTNWLWGPCVNVVRKAYNIGSYSTQFWKVTVAFTVYDMCMLCLFQVCLPQGVRLTLLDLFVLALSHPSSTLVVAESFLIHLLLLLLPLD